MSVQREMTCNPFFDTSRCPPTHPKIIHGLDALHAWFLTVCRVVHRDISESARCSVWVRPSEFARRIKK